MIRKNIRELVNTCLLKYITLGLSIDETRDHRIPAEVCSMGDLKDYLDLITDEAIEHAIQDEMDAAADEARDDARNMGHHI